MIPGDGIGPEVVAEGLKGLLLEDIVKCLEAARGGGAEQGQGPRTAAEGRAGAPSGGRAAAPTLFDHPRRPN